MLIRRLPAGSPHRYPWVALVVAASLPSGVGAVAGAHALSRPVSGLLLGLASLAGVCLGAGMLLRAATAL